MILLNAQLKHLYLLPGTKHPDVLFQELLQRARQYSKSVFRRPHYVISTLVNNMREFSMFTSELYHTAKLRQSPTHITTV